MQKEAEKLTGSRENLTALGESLIALGSGVDAAVATTAHWLSKWVYNIRLNIPAINEDFEKGDANLGSLDPSEFWPRVKDPRQLLVLGSGPSLHLADDLIKDWKGILIAGPTNAGWAAAHGRIPDIIFSTDASEDSVTALGNYEWDTYGAILVTSVEGNVNMVRRWRLKRKWFLAHMSPMDGSLQPEKEMYNVVQNLMFPEIRTWGFMVGCTPNQAIQQMWYWGLGHEIENIFTLGTDFAYGPDLQRHKKWEYAGPPHREWIEIGKGNQIERNQEGFLEVNGRKTTQQMFRYLDNYYKVVMLNNMSVYDCSDGIVEYVPKANIAKVIETTGEAYAPLTKEEITQCMQPYRAKLLAQRTERAQADSTSGTSFKIAPGSSIFDMLKVSFDDGQKSPSSSGELSTQEKPATTGQDQEGQPQES